MSRRLRLLICAAVFVVGIGQTALAFSRSLIPYELDGELDDVEVVGDSAQRLHTVTVAGRRYETDNQAVAELQPGRHLDKRAWSVVLVADGRKDVRLAVGDEALQFGVLTLVATGAAAVLTSGAQGSEPAGGDDAVA